MERRVYRLGKRQGSADRTRGAILAAARDLIVATGNAGLSMVAVAQRAGVSRITVYQHFGSKLGLIQALSGQALSGVERLEAPDQSLDARAQLRERIAAACSVWASDPALFRRLASPVQWGPRAEDVGGDPVREADPAGWGRQGEDRALAERLAATDQLRPGCSLREAEDVIATLTAFPTFDRLARDGRRSPSAVSEILLRLAAAILA